MKIAALLFAAIFTSSVFAAGTCDSYTLFKTYPEIGEVAKQAENLRSAIEKKKPFAEVLRLAVDLDTLASRTMEIREQGCGDADVGRMERCLKPVEWSCESTRPQVNFSGLVRLATTAEEKATIRFLDVLKTGDMFHTCCNDFGCLQDGVGEPTALEAGGTFAEFVRLALSKGEYAERARKVLENGVPALSTAKCRCPETEYNSAQELATEVGVVAKTVTKASDPDKAVRKLLDQLESTLKKGFPLAVCAMPS